MQQETDSVMALIRHYAIFNETAFTMCTSYSRHDSAETDCESALNVACCVHCPSVELLQLLLQLDPSQATKRASDYSFTALAQLCYYAIRFRNEGTKYTDTAHCLLSVDSTAEYIGRAFVDFSAVLVGPKNGVTRIRQHRYNSVSLLSWICCWR